MEKKIKKNQVEILRRNGWIKVLLIFLYIGFYVANTSFFHTHHYLTFSVTHSHPFLKTSKGIPDHAHEKASLDTIDQINTIAIDFVLVFFSLAAIGILLSTFIQYPRFNIILRVVDHYHLRAPPMY